MMDLQEIFKRGGALSKCLANYEPRSGQTAMAEAVESVLQGEDEFEIEVESGRILVIEAETGIGKTLAYLIPAALSGRRVVVSTATLNLQDQIINKDIPLVEKVLDLNLSALCVKGRENYLCLYRWYQYRSTPQLSLVDNPWLSDIDSWLEKTDTGDRAELDWLGEQSRIWPKISSLSTQCLGSECPESTGCFITKLRKKAGKARLLIVNHHLFFSDLVLRKGGFGELLPRYESVIFDEAHHLENVATTFFGKSFSQYQLLDLIGDIERQAKVDLPDDLIDALFAELGGIRRRVDQFTHVFPVKKGRYHLGSLIDELEGDVWQDEVELLSSAIRRLEDQLAEHQVYGDGWAVLTKRCEELNERLREIALGCETDDKKFVHWYEKRERAVSISATPIEVAKDLQENLY
ncbi:MAG: ATP-dependent DNA helicase, partial [Desulforhopalus sp.]